MSQNIYDDENFFAGYSAIDRSVQGLAGAAEWPAMQALLPPMDGLRVLDLGCGFGWFARWARAAGAATVLGLDLSERMLARAQADTDDAAITYGRADLDTLSLPEGCFDLVYSSLALHYAVAWERLAAQVHGALEPTGRFVFSVEHPIYTAPSVPGWVDQAGRKIWPLDDYLVEGPRITNWLAPGVVKQHRGIGTYVDVLLRAGFNLTALQEWGPSDAQIVDHPEWAVERNRPPFLLVSANRV